MKHLTRILSAVLSAILLTAAAGCAPQAPAEKEVVSVGTIQGPTGIGMVHLMHANEHQASQNRYRFSVASSPEELAAKLVNGELDIAALPTNVAAALYNKTGGKIQLLAVNTFGVLYILENGETVHTIADLKGKTVYSTGEGANPQFILEYLLKKNGLMPGRDVTVTYLAENTELAAKLISGEITVALVPQPTAATVTMKNSSVRTAVSINAAWDAVAEGKSRLMMGCVAVRKPFAESHKAAVDRFLDEYKTSVEQAADAGTTAPLCESYGIVPSAAIAQAAIPYCELTYLDSTAMKEKLVGYYTVLLNANPASLGRKLPQDDFYYVH